MIIKLLKNNKKLLILIVLFVALVFRLAIISYATHPDIFSFASWGKWIYDYGTKGFYENNVWVYEWPNLPPLLNLIFVGMRWFYLFSLKTVHLFDYYLIPSFISYNLPGWKDWVSWYGETNYYPYTFLPNGYIICLKLVGVISDLLIGWLAFKVAIKHLSYKSSLILASLFVLLPFSWYLSTLWGQYESLVALFLIGGILLLIKRSFLLSVLFIAISISIKPTSGVYLPVYLVYFFSLRPKISTFLISIFLVIILIITTVAPFANKDLFTYLYNDIYPKVFSEYRFRITDHAFNFWSIFYPSGVWLSSKNILFLPASTWSLFVFVGLIIWSSLIVIKGNIKNVLKGFYLMGGGSYLFMTGMHDRYFFSAVALLGFLTIFYSKLLKYWILTTLLFFFNLLYSWGYPIFTPGQVWDNSLVIQISSIGQVVLFIICLYELGLLYKIRRG